MPRRGDTWGHYQKRIGLWGTVCRSALNAWRSEHRVCVEALTENTAR